MPRVYTFSDARFEFIDTALRVFKRDTITRNEVLHLVETYNTHHPQWLTKDKSLRVHRGVYRLPLDEKQRTWLKRQKPEPLLGTSNIPVAAASIA